MILILLTFDRFDNYNFKKPNKRTAKINNMVINTCNNDFFSSKIKQWSTTANTTHMTAA